MFKSYFIQAGRSERFQDELRVSHQHAQGLTVTHKKGEGGLKEQK